MAEPVGPSSASPRTSPRSANDRARSTRRGRCRGGLGGGCDTHRGDPQPGTRATPASVGDAACARGRRRQTVVTDAQLAAASPLERGPWPCTRPIADFARCSLDGRTGVRTPLLLVLNRITPGSPFCPGRMIASLRHERQRPPVESLPAPSGPGAEGRAREIASPRAGPSRPVGTQDVLPAGVRPVGGARRRVRGGCAARPATGWSTARCSRTSACSSGSARAPTSSARRCTTSTTRAAATSPCGPRAPPRWCRAFVQHRPPTPWKVWYAAPELPLRAAAGRPLPPAPPGRRRGDRLRRPRPRRRGDRPRPRSTASARPAAVSRSLLNSMGDARLTGPRYAETLPAWLRRPRRRPGRRRPRRRSTPQPAAGARLQAARRPQAATADAPRIADDLLRAACPSPLRAGADGPRRARHRLRHRARARARPRLLHAHHLRVPGDGARRRPRTRSAAAAATTAWSRSSAGRRRPASASAPASSGCCSPATPRACSGAPESALDVFVVDVTGGDAGPRPHRTSCARAGIRADRAFDGRSMKSQMKAADRSGARLALIVGRAGGGRRHGHRPRPRAATGEQHAGRRADRRSSVDPTATPRTSARFDVSRNRAAVPAHGLVRRAAARATSGGRSRSAAGWPRRREHGEHLAFVDVRDHTGVVQCVVDGAADLRTEYVVRVTGTVRARPEGTVNPELATGEVEVGDCTVEVLTTAEPPPFPVDDRRRRRRDGPPPPPLRRPAPRPHAAQPAASGPTVNSAIRARHGARRASSRSRRRCSSRRPPRAPATSSCRRACSRARFYALPQSPQLFKQLLHGRRHRPLLPDRPLPARRGPAGRPPVRVHAARRRGQLRRPGRGARRSSPRPSGAAEAVGRDRPGAIPTHDVARRHGALRLRQARHALRHGAGRAHRRCSPRPSSTPSRRRASRASACRGGAELSAATSSTTSPTRPSAGAPRASCG